MFPPLIVRKGIEMKKHMVVLVAAIVVMAPANARAQESQVYNPYPPTNFVDPNGVAQVAPQAGGMYAQQVESYQNPPRYRVYPGRERYGQGFGPIPRHPGDYRDALDRGQFSSGNSAPGAPLFAPY